MTSILRTNLDIKSPGIRKNPRFRAAVTSIKLLVSPDDKLIILSHFGRPSPEKMEKDLSLKPFVPLLQREIGKKVFFLDNFDFPQIRKSIESAPGGSVFLLENVRYLKGELEDDIELGRNLASLGERFINDDFASSHRKHASLSAITRFIPSSAGPQIKHELEHLRLIMAAPEKPFVIIIGGAKVSDKLGVLKKLLPRADAVLLGGVPANTVLQARGRDIGASLADQDIVSQLHEIVQSEKVIVPDDFRKEKDIIYDIGPRTVKKYTAVIGTARNIIWNGPMGFTEKRKFARGTRDIARAVFANRHAKTIIGGGDTLSAVPYRFLKNSSKNILISTGGGAMLLFLAGEPLPALESLDKTK
ncbi:MAG: phosphoglycerate kinase [Candidatus Colwellbacteria bacterium]|nr:phosphoglycerate kinase [Candidatus Colwellbacteria bacterium]